MPVKSYNHYSFYDSKCFNLFYCHFLQKKLHYWPTGLGNGWALTVINTSAEFDNIERGLDFLDVRGASFLTIDGSTNVSNFRKIDYSEYIPGQSG